jgi:hypothetical protein
MRDKLGAAEINLSSEIDRERNSRQLVGSKSIMKSRFNYAAVENEINHPYVVELAVVSDGLNIELCRRIMQFHKLRQVELRYGRRLTRGGGKIHYGWCFADLLIARAFAEQFGGEFRKRTPFQTNRTLRFRAGGNVPPRGPSSSKRGGEKSPNMCANSDSETAQS